VSEPKKVSAVMQNDFGVVVTIPNAALRLIGINNSADSYYNRNRPNAAQIAARLQEVLEAHDKAVKSVLDHHQLADHVATALQRVHAYIEASTKVAEVFVDAPLAPAEPPRVER